MFFNAKSKNLWVAIRGNLSHFRCLACLVVEFNFKCPFNTGWQQYHFRLATIPFQVLFRCPRPLNRGVRLIKVAFKVNKGNKFGGFGYCPLNRGCPLNTGFTVPWNNCKHLFLLSLKTWVLLHRIGCFLHFFPCSLWPRASISNRESWVISCSFGQMSRRYSLYDDSRPET